MKLFGKLTLILALAIIALLQHFNSPAWLVWGVVGTGLYLYCIGFILQIFPKLGRSTT